MHKYTKIHKKYQNSNYISSLAAAWLKNTKNLDRLKASDPKFVLYLSICVSVCLCIFVSGKKSAFVSVFGIWGETKRAHWVVGHEKCQNRKEQILFCTNCRAPVGQSGSLSGYACPPPTSSLLPLPCNNKNNAKESSYWFFSNFLSFFPYFLLCVCFFLGKEVSYWTFVCLRLNSYFIEWYFWRNAKSQLPTKGAKKKQKNETHDFDVRLRASVCVCACVCVALKAFW